MRANQSTNLDTTHCSESHPFFLNPESHPLLLTLCPLSLIWSEDFFLWILGSFFPERFSQDLVFCFPCVAHPLQHGSLLHGLGYCHHQCRRVSLHISEYSSPLASSRTQLYTICMLHPLLTCGEFRDHCWQMWMQKGCRLFHLSHVGLSQGLSKAWLEMACFVHYWTDVAAMLKKGTHFLTACFVHSVIQ